MPECARLGGARRKEHQRPLGQHPIHAGHVEVTECRYGLGLEPEARRLDTFVFALVVPTAGQVPEEPLLPQEPLSAHTWIPEHQCVHAASALRFVSGEQSAHSNADKADPGSTSGGEFVGGRGDAGKPCRHPVWIGLLTGRVAGAVVVEPQDGQTLLGEPVGKEPVAEVDADRFDTQGLTEDDTPADFSVPGKVHPSEQRPLMGPEPARSWFDWTPRWPFGHQHSLSDIEITPKDRARFHDRQRSGIP